MSRKEFIIYISSIIVLIINVILFICLLFIIKELSSLKTEYYNTLKILSELNQHINYPGG